MTEDRIFLQIIKRLRVIYPKVSIEIGKTYREDIDGLEIIYDLYIGEEDYNFCCLTSLCEFVSKVIAEHDPVFARRKMLRDRDWDNLFKGGDNGRDAT